MTSRAVSVPGASGAAAPVSGSVSMYRMRTFGTRSAEPYRSAITRLRCSATRYPVWPMATTSAGNSAPSPDFSGGAMPVLPIRPVWTMMGRLSVCAGFGMVEAPGVTNLALEPGETSEGSGVTWTP